MEGARHITSLVARSNVSHTWEHFSASLWYLPGKFYFGVRGSVAVVTQGEKGWEQLPDKLVLVARGRPRSWLGSCSTEGPLDNKISVLHKPSMLCRMTCRALQKTPVRIARWSGVGGPGQQSYPQKGLHAFSLVEVFKVATALTPPPLNHRAVGVAPFPNGDPLPPLYRCCTDHDAAASDAVTDAPRSELQVRCARSEQFPTPQVQGVPRSPSPPRGPRRLTDLGVSPLSSSPPRGPRRLTYPGVSPLHPSLPWSLVHRCRSHAP